jgi:glutamate formiminotransferase/formiminotetrahydrofolate cyclodeaminase
MKQIIECVPNFSEGRNQETLNQIKGAIESVAGAKLLDMDPGKATNRTVVTIVGEPEQVIEAAYKAIVLAGELIDMSKHSGEHARMGATDVCPLIPVANISMEETAAWAVKLAEKVGNTTDIPVYLYGAAQKQDYRKDLSIIRAGEYEGFFEKIKQDKWKPDYGPQVMNAKKGATVIGARDFLVAYNVNLNSTSTRLANRVAFDVREAGRVKREGNPYTGKIVRDEQGEAVRIPGSCKSVKAVGWFIEEYGVAQISANLTNIDITPMHVFFEEVDKSCQKRGLRITGSELVGLVPLKAMLDAGRYFLNKQERSEGVSEDEIIKIAIKSMGLDELGPFDPKQKIIEYRLKELDDERLVQLSCKEFANETASESMAPGGGSVSAYVGSLGAALGTMVANLGANKRGWEDRVDYFSEWAVKGQRIKDELLFLVDEDTRSFNAIIEGIRMPKDTDEEKALRSKAIEEASIYAAEVPLKVMSTSYRIFELSQEMVSKGNPSSVTDAGVGALCAFTAMEGAYMNVMVNVKDLSTDAARDRISTEATDLLKQGQEALESVKKNVYERLFGQQIS